MFTNMNSTPWAGLAGVLLTVAMISAAAGVALSGTDFLNYNTSAAAARALDQETDFEAQKAAIDLEYYRALQSVQTQSEQEELRLRREALKRELDQRLAHERKMANLQIELTRLTRYVVLSVGIAAALILSSGAAAFLVLHGRSQLASARAKAVGADLWRDPVWRAEQLRRARAVEIAERRATLQQAEQGSAVGGNGRHSLKISDFPIPIALDPRLESDHLS